MKQSCLLLSVVLLVGVPSSFEECVLESIQGAPNYVCNSVQELEEQGQSNVFDVQIYNNNKPSDLSNKKLNLKIVLVQDINTSGISPDTFRLLKELSKLFGPNHEVNTLPATLFANLPIQELNLHDNGINNIEQGAFSSLRDLEELYIVDNKLSIVKNGIFNGLLVEILALSRNRISFIEKDAFKDMSVLKRLHLNGNRLSEFQPEIIMNNPLTLEELFLHHNFFTDVGRNSVRGLSNLKNLNLDDNKISRVSSYTFDDLSNLETLNLANNLFLDLPAEAFPTNGLPKLSKLYLQNNRLSYLTTLALERLRNLEHIRIGGNPWQCPCLEAILTWLSDHGVQQKCDKDYFNGTRPICVVDDVHPTRCVYESDNSYYLKYSEINNKAPKSPDCVL